MVITNIFLGAKAAPKRCYRWFRGWYKMTILDKGRLPKKTKPYISQVSGGQNGRILLTGFFQKLVN
jgi:hypothetical protein